MAEPRVQVQKEKKGLVMIFTGNGKGKTTAAMGLALRAAGNRMPVLVVQFIKGRWKTGEQTSLQALSDQVTLVRMGKGFTIERLRDQRIEMDEHRAAAAEALAFARQEMQSGRYQVVILDEILGAIKAELVSLDDVVSLATEKPPLLHLVMTGRGAPEALINAADLVTEMREIKHPYQQGIVAQRGVEF